MSMTRALDYFFRDLINSLTWISSEHSETLTVLLSNSRISVSLRVRRSSKITVVGADIRPVLSALYSAISTGLGIARELENRRA